MYRFRKLAIGSMRVRFLPSRTNSFAARFALLGCAEIPGAGFPAFLPEERGSVSDFLFHSTPFRYVLHYT